MVLTSGDLQAGGGRALYQAAVTFVFRSRPDSPFSSED